MAKIDVKKIANLANLPITSEEQKVYQRQLEKILEYVDQIEKKVTAAKTEATFNISSKLNKESKDISVPPLSQPEALKNAPDSKNGYFKSKRTIQHG